MKHAALFALGGFSLASSVAAQNTVFGTWCSEGGGIVIEATGMGDFEHTVCEFDTQQLAGRAVATPMTCRVYHYQDDGPAIETRSDDYDLSAVLVDNDTLSINYDDGRGAFELSRCDNG